MAKKSKPASKPDAPQLVKIVALPGAEHRVNDRLVTEMEIEASQLSQFVYPGSGWQEVKAAETEKEESE